MYAPAAVPPQETWKRETKIVPRSDMLVLERSEHKGRVRACVSAQSQIKRKTEEPGDPGTLKIRGCLYSPESKPNLQGLLRNNKLTQSRLQTAHYCTLDLLCYYPHPALLTTAVLLTQIETININSCRNRQHKVKLCSTAHRCT